MAEYLLPLCEYIALFDSTQCGPACVHGGLSPRPGHRLMMATDLHIFHQIERTATAIALNVILIPELEESHIGGALCEKPPLS
jgi:hypothetical protein